MSHTILSHANFFKATVTHTNFSDSNLSQANFQEADIGYSQFTNANLEKTRFVLVKNLDTAMGMTNAINADDAEF